MSANPGNQTSLISISSLPELTDLVRREWVYNKEYLPRVAKQLFLVQPIGAGQGSSKRIKEVDVETFSDFKPEGANSLKARVGLGYEKDIVARTFSKEIDITLEMRNDNRYADVGALIVSLSQFCENRQDLDLTHVLTFANATSYVDLNGETIDNTVGDGLAILSAVHTLAFSSTTYNNIVTGNPAFSQGSYEAALLVGATQIYSNFGEQRNMDFNTVVCGRDPGTKRTIKQLFNSQADIDAVQSGVVNVYKDGNRMVELYYLSSTAAGAYDSTKRRWWFLAAIGHGAMGSWQAYVGDWIAPTLVTPASGNNGEDIHNFNWTYAAYCRYGIAVLSGRGLVGSCPTS